MFTFHISPQHSLFQRRGVAPVAESCLHYVSFLHGRVRLSVTRQMVFPRSAEFLSEFGTQISN